jgi:hypothetical protein
MVGLREFIPGTTELVGWWLKRPDRRVDGDFGFILSEMNGEKS